MGDYGAWQVSLWQNADVVLFFLKTDYYCKFILKFATLALSLHKKTKSVRFLHQVTTFIQALTFVCRILACCLESDACCKADKSGPPQIAFVLKSYNYELYIKF